MFAGGRDVYHLVMVAHMQAAGEEPDLPIHSAMSRQDAVNKEQAMSKSPGHQQDSRHQVNESKVTGRMKVVIGGEAIASSNDVIAVHEDGCPVRFYFPKSAVKSADLQESSLTTECPFKGTARYFNLVHGDHTLANAIWSYEDPYDEHRDLKGRLAFYDDKYSDISVMREA